MDTDSSLIENIKACRTCGIHYVTPTQHQLKHLFQSSREQSDVMLIRLELSQWNVEVAENDGFPQYVCNTCIRKFEQVFELRAACINTQNEFRKFYAVPNGIIPNIKIKTELQDMHEEQPICDFIYVDELSDTEYDGATPFNFPHVPIKEEVIEAATIPIEELEQTASMVESASRVVKQKGPSSLHVHEFMSHKSLVVSQSAMDVQENVDRFECKLCHHFSSNQDEHKQHMQTAHEIRDFECHICGKQFKNSTPARLKFHLKWHTLNKHLKCTLCGIMCNSKYALKEHKRINHRKLNCKICRKGVLAKKMKLHLRQHELLLQYSCEYCAEAFDTEIQRENHIWQIHANADNAISNSILTTCTQIISENHIMVPKEEISRLEKQEILYKFMCAHCDHKFIEQIDLETHVKEKHRSKSQLASVKSKTGVFFEDAQINEISQTTQNENDKVFLEYGNDNQILDPGNYKTSILQQSFILPSSQLTFITQTENLQNREPETAFNTSNDEESELTESEDGINGHFANDFNMFACAKCSETFAAIEQLRQHYEQHLEADQQQQKPKISPIKSKFKCNLCEKSFNLKFTLNRHVKKHKHAPI